MSAMKPNLAGGIPKKYRGAKGGVSPAGSVLHARLMRALVEKRKGNPYGLKPGVAYGPKRDTSKLGKPSQMKSGKTYRSTKGY